MAFSSRFLSKSKQIYRSGIILQQERAIPVRFFAKEAAPAPIEGDQMLKNMFLEVRKRFETAKDPAVSHYANVMDVMKTVREKADFSSETQRIQYTIQTLTQNIADARTYLSTMKEIRINRGLQDDLGIETMMMDALEKTEKDLKKPLMRNDKKGMAVLMAEFEKINNELGIHMEDLADYEDKLKIKNAKAQVEEMKEEVSSS